MQAPPASCPRHLRRLFFFVIINLTMNIFSAILYYTLQWTIGLPQNLAGFVLWFYWRVLRKAERHGRYRFAAVTGWKKRSSMGLGMFIFMGESFPLKGLPDGGTGAYEEHVLSHEYGHTVQSVILGPLFLPVIGLPSIVWCNFPPAAKRWKSGKKDYESFYPERWATHLGLKTEARHRKPGVLTTKPEDTVSA